MLNRPFIKTLATVVLSMTFCALYIQAAPDSVMMKRRAQEAFVNGAALQMRPDKQAEAILEFQQALRYDSSAAILFAIARSYAAMDKNALALEYVQNALARDSMLVDAWELQSEILVDLGKYDEALASYEHVRGLHPTKRQLYTLGRLYEPRNAAKAVEVFEELVRRDPDESIYMRLADLHRRLRNTEARIDALARAAALNTRDADIASELMDAYVTSGRIAEAHTLVNAWKGSERNSQIWAAGLGRLIEDTLVLQLNKDSVQVMLIELEREPAKPWQLAAIAGMVALLIEDTSLADRLFESALLPTSSQAEQYLQVAAANLSVRRTNSAFEVLQRGLAKHPNDIRILMMLGSVAQQMELVRDAIVWFNRVVERDTTVEDAWMRLGMLYDSQDDSVRSDSAYDRTLILNPNNSMANNNYAYSLAMRGKNLQQARTMAWRAVEQEQKNPSYLDTFAWVLFQLGEFEKARTYIERAVLWGGNATHYDHLGDILEQLGDLDGAIEAWRKSLVLDPSRDSVQNKLVRYR